MMKNKNRIIVAILTFALAVSSFTLQSADTQSATSRSKSAIKAYKKILSSEKEAKKVATYFDRLKFDVIDINKDGIKEIVVTDDDGYHAEIYAYVNGKVKEVGSSFASGNGDKYYPDRHIYYTQLFHSGEYLHQYYKFDGKKMKLVAEQNGYDVYVEQIDKIKTVTEYLIKGKPVSRRKYKAYVKKILNGAKGKKFKWHKNTKANRQKYLR